VHGLHDEVRFTVEFDDLAFADVVGGGHERRALRVLRTWF
jgi:hypothetical protein